MSASVGWAWAWAGVAASAVLGAGAAAVGVAAGRWVPKVDPLWPLCPACDGPVGLGGTVRPWQLPARCRTCHRSVRGPTLLLDAVGAAALALLVRLGDHGWLLVAHAWSVAVLVGLVWCDARHRLLPARLVWAGTAGALVLLALADATQGGPGSLGRAVVVGGVAGVGALGLHRASPDGLAFGDVRLCVLLGVVLGWRSASGFAWAFVLAAALGVAWGLLGSARRADRTLPFGPFLALAAGVVLVVGAT